MGEAGKLWTRQFWGSNYLRQTLHRGEDWKLESVLSLGSARVHDMPSHRKLLLLVIPISDAPECLGSFSALCGFVYHTVKVCFSAGFLRVIRFPLFGVCTGFEWICMFALHLNFLACLVHIPNPISLHIYWTLFSHVPSQFRGPSPGLSWIGTLAWCICASKGATTPGNLGFFVVSSWFGVWNSCRKTLLWLKTSHVFFVRILRGALARGHLRGYTPFSDKPKSCVLFFST